MTASKLLELALAEKEQPKRYCPRCGDELEFSDDLICGYHILED